jgi:hypothetical protein
MNGTELRGSRGLFLLTILTGSFLLFLVQPMIARMAPPWRSACRLEQRNARLSGTVARGLCLCPSVGA